MTELLHSSAADLAALIASGLASSREVTQAHLDRIDAVDGSVRAFLHVDGERALAAADAVDGKRAAGDIAGAREASGKAKFWAMLSAGLALIPITLYLVFVLFLGGLGVLGGLSGVN